MILPEKFDQNEWFIIVSFIFVLCLLYFLPNRFPLSVRIMIFVFASSVGRLTDRYLAGPHFNLYDIMDTGKYDFFDTLTYFLYALFALLFVYGFEKLKIKGVYSILYLVLCTIAGTTFEWLSVQFNVFTFHGWKSQYSFIFYLIIQSFTLLFYTYVRKVYKKTTDRNILS